VGQVARFDNLCLALGGLLSGVAWQLYTLDKIWAGAKHVNEGSKSQCGPSNACGRIRERGAAQISAVIDKTIT